MTAAEIARALGAGHRSGRWWRCRCPAHGSRGPTLAMRDGDNGPIVHCHAGCPPGDILAELRRRGLLGGTEDAGSVRFEQGTPPYCADDRRDRQRRIEITRGIWRAARDGREGPVVHYLAGRAITIAPPASLRWAPALRRPDGTYGPAMVARVEGLDGKLIGVHRTYLALDPGGIWLRRDRASLGPIGGGAVRLAPAAETLMVGEGIETNLAAMQATAMPAWAALSTSGMKALALPPIVRTVIILADKDPNGAGERAALAAASRWIAEGRRVRIAMPPEPGTDFNDVLAGHAYAQVAETSVVAA